MLGHVISSTNGQPYTIKINQDFLMRLLKRGGAVFLRYLKIKMKKYRWEITVETLLSDKIALCKNA